MQRTFVDGRYVVERLLGNGGMAQVYLTHDEVLDRQVALKILRDQYAEDEEFVERFRREARSAASLSHPNIVSIYDQGRSENGAYYIAMEYVPRGTLKERIKRDGALDSGVAAGVALQIADALQTAHENGVIHRDIKPHNVLVTKTGDVKVTDFGIARAASSPLTQTSAVLGTAGYMSPEQTRGEKVGPASDLYSLGVVLYEMLTGSLPYTADNPVAQAMMHINEPPRSPRLANPNVPEALDAVTLKLLAKDPEARYASTAELADDLERVRSGLPPAAVDAQKTTAARAAPLPTAPATLPQEQTAKTAIRPPIVPPPRASRPGGFRQGRLPRVLGALLLGLVLLAGLTWVLTNAMSESGNSGDVSEGQSEANQDEKPVAEESTIVLIPDLVWYSTAAADLGSAGLYLGAVEEVPNDTFLAGQVIETNPFEGTEAEAGATVDITVSTGPRQVPVDKKQAQEEEKQKEKQRQEQEKQAEKQQQEQEKQAEKQQQAEEKRRERGE